MRINVVLPRNRRKSSFWMGFYRINPTSPGNVILRLRLTMADITWSRTLLFYGTATPSWYFALDDDGEQLMRTNRRWLAAWRASGSMLLFLLAAISLYVQLLSVDFLLSLLSFYFFYTCASSANDKRNEIQETFNWWEWNKKEKEKEIGVKNFLGEEELKRKKKMRDERRAQQWKINRV